MMKMFSFTVKLLLFTCIAFSQTNSVTGIIVDADDGQSITGCNVFISNTTKGKVTDTAGRFTLYGIPEGKSYELVVSSAGYETSTYAFSSAQLPLNLKVSLNRKILAMQNVTIVPVEIDGWIKWGPLFLKNFLGTSENALECEIENTNIIEFRRNKKENRLEASADGFLVIKNYRLGFNIKYQLEQFIYDFKNKSLTYQGYPLFEEMEMELPMPPKFGRRRLKAYNGSLIHFMRSLYSNSLKAEGFEARRMVRTIAYDTIMNDFRHTNLVLYDSTGKKIKLPAYYVKKAAKDNFGSTTLNSDSVLFKGSDNIKDILSFDNYLVIRYLSESEPVEFSRQFMNRKSQHFQLTNFIILNEEKSILIRPDGYYFPSLDLLIEGYLGWEKIGDLLPLDYYPPK